MLYHLGNNLTATQLPDQGIRLKRNGKGVVLRQPQMDALIRWYDAGCCALCHTFIPGTIEPGICPACLEKERNRHANMESTLRA
jgi:hypothetical protein